MWSYYGAKTKIIDHYPPPKFDKIIEPFAGTSRYALKYFDRDVLLVDKYDVIVKIWKWLQQCSPKDIMGLPSFKKGDDIRSFNLIDEAKYLMGFCMGRGNSYPTNVGGNFQDWESDKIRISKNLFKIKHWEILQGSYEQLENELAVWYVDPPYQFGGHKYKEGNKNFDFGKLAQWCLDRDGQVIVCENTKADWMNFKPILPQRGSRFTTIEAIWSNYPTAFDHQQMKLDL